MILKWRPSRGVGDRAGFQVDLIVLHYTWGSYPGDYETLTKSPAPGYPSSHFYIRKSGDIYQLVRQEQAAFHAGISWGRKDSWEYKRWAAIRPNERSVGIEMESKGTFTEAQYIALEWLIPLIALRHKIPLVTLPDPWRGHDANAESDAYELETLATFRGILGHGAIAYSKVDPGMAFDYTRIRKLRPLAAGPLDYPSEVVWRGDPRTLPSEGLDLGP